jgi:Family of unknown function (DUF6076)
MSAMQVSVSYRQVVLRDPGRDASWQLPLAAPVNDLLGLAISPDAEVGGYLIYLMKKYEGFGMHGLGGAQQALAAFDRAAVAAAKRRLSPELAPYLERIKFSISPGTDDVPDFVALAAWSLLESLRRQSLALITCPRCKRPWFGAPKGPRHCQRPAPGQSRDCRTLEKERRLASNPAYRAYRREYKRLEEAARRGSVTFEDFIEWRTANRAHAWRPFDEWKAKRPQTRKEK